jgi:hypothetical protein
MICPKAVAAALVCLVASVPAQASWGHGAGADVVLAIEASGRVKGEGSANPWTEACRLFLSLLDAETRVGLVSFDASPRTRAPMTPLGAQREDLLYRLGLISFEGRGTDLYQAVLHSSQMLTDASRDRPAIVLLTDGRMDAGDASRDRRMAASLSDSLIPEMRRRGIRVFSVALTRKADAGLLEKAALGSDGFFHPVESEGDLHGAFLSVYERLAEPDTIPLDRDEFYVDRSVRQVDAVIGRADPGVPVVLVDPDHKEHSYADHSSYLRWDSLQSFETIRISRPTPGPWRIRAAAEKGTKIFALTDLRLRTDFSRCAVPAGAPIAIEAWVQRNDEAGTGSALRSQDLRITGTLEGAGGERSSLPFVDDGSRGDKRADDGIYTGLLTGSRQGEHRLRVRAYAITFEREREYTFCAAGEEFVPVEEARAQSARGPEGKPAAEPQTNPTEASAEKERSDSSRGSVTMAPFRLLLMIEAILLLSGGLGYAAYRLRPRRRVAHGPGRPDNTALTRKLEEAIEETRKRLIACREREHEFAVFLAAKIAELHLDLMRNTVARLHTEGEGPLDSIAGWICEEFPDAAAARLQGIEMHLELRHRLERDGGPGGPYGRETGTGGLSETEGPCTATVGCAPPLKG